MATTALPILDDAVNSASITDLNRMKRDDLKKALDTGAVYVVHLDRRTRPVGVFLGIALYRQLTRELLPRTDLHPVIRERKSYYVPKAQRPKDMVAVAEPDPEPVPAEEVATAPAPAPEPELVPPPPIEEEKASVEDELEFWGDDVPWK